MQAVDQPPMAVHAGSSKQGTTPAHHVIAAQPQHAHNRGIQGKSAPPQQQQSAPASMLSTWVSPHQHNTSAHSFSSHRQW